MNVVLKMAADLEDQETVDLFTGIGVAYQKHIWMYTAWMTK